MTQQTQVLNSPTTPWGSEAAAGRLYGKFRNFPGDCRKAEN
jgi:hypothetical protein